MINLKTYEDKLKRCQHYDEVINLMKEMTAPILEKMLETEMDQELGYRKYDQKNKTISNSRNGFSKKNLKTTNGNLELKIPRDRENTFEPIVVPKNSQTIETELEKRIISMYAKGLTLSDIESYIKDIYGVNISSDFISKVTDKILPEVENWQNRALDRIYTILYLDAIHFKVREGGKIITKAAYTVLGINLDGKKDLLGIWVGENEGAKYWLRVLNEIKSRGVEDVLISCIDGLKGFPEALQTVFPKTEVQVCIVHQIRNSLKYIPHKDMKKVAADLKKIYQANTEELALKALDDLEQNWKKYAPCFRSWRNNWANLSTFFVYPEAIRRIIYTTNTVEGLHRQFRKVTKNSIIFPNNQALIKRLWLAQNDISKKWSVPIRNWGEIISQLAIFFDGRINL